VLKIRCFLAAAILVAIPSTVEAWFGWYPGASKAGS
jgi:hypothetical protein